MLSIDNIIIISLIISSILFVCFASMVKDSIDEKEDESCFFEVDDQGNKFSDFISKR